jgi:hypothetical protein
MRMEKQIQKFYRKWSPGVLAFCWLLLGEGSDAEQSAVEAFQAYFSRRPSSLRSCPRGFIR